MRVNSLIIMIMVFLVGCSSGGSYNPIIPGDSITGQFNSEITPLKEARNNRALVGLWDIHVSADRQTIDVIPQRASASHFNLVYFMETDPCHDCLKLKNFETAPPFGLNLDMQITHPFPGIPELTCFDPRGIIITKGDTYFPGWVKFCTLEWGSLILLNPDGYTSIFNPTDYPQDAPVHPLLKYVPGKYQINGLLDATLNPFVAYQKDEPRRMFRPGDISTRTLNVILPFGPLIFGYALDVSWSPAPGEVNDPEVDFPIEANCLEAYQIDVQLEGDITEIGSSVSVNATVYDHQGVETILAVQLYAPQIFNGELTLDKTGQQGETIGFYSGELVNEFATPGTYGALVRVIGSDIDPNHGNILGWQLIKIIRDIPVPDGWAVSWAGFYPQWDAKGEYVTADTDGNVFSAGHWGGKVDFDPGPGIDMHETEHVYGGWLDEVYLSKFSPDGDFQWAATWGEYPNHRVGGLACDEWGNTYLTAWYVGTMDFDPGPGVDERTTPDLNWDMYLSKFSPNGHFEWVATSEIPDEDKGFDVACAKDGSSAIYVVGRVFAGMVGDSVNDDSYLVKYNYLGESQWIVSWGSEQGDNSEYVVCGSAGDVYVMGEFQETADFDPGPGTDLHTAPQDMNGVFISKFDSNGNFIWCRTSGSSFYNSNGATQAHMLAIDGNDNVYMIGQITGTVDIDPGPGQDLRNDIDGKGYVAKLNSDGDYIWGRQFVQSSEDWHVFCSLAVNDAGEVLLSGNFDDEIDLDPGPGEDIRYDLAGSNHYLIMLDTSGNYKWGRTWHNLGSDYGEHEDAAFDDSGNIFTTGSFEGVMNFDTGGGSVTCSAPEDNAASIAKYNPDGYM